MANSVNFSTYGFLDDILALTEENWRRYFKPFIYDSVQSGLQVSAGSGMTVNVSSGECRCGSIMGILSSPVSLDAYVGDETYPRIDCIIAQYTYDDPSTLVVAVLKGTAGETPVAPSLVNSYNSLWQMELAQILVPAGATTTAECTITDKRVIYNSLDDKLSVYSSNASEWDTTPTTNSTKPVTSGGTKNALDEKLANYASGASEWDTTPTANSNKPVTSGGINTELNKKVTDYANGSTEWDTSPTANSTKPVTSGGIKTELNKKLTNYANGASEWDTTPSSSSTKPVTSGGIKTYVDNKVLYYSSAGGNQVAIGTGTNSEIGRIPAGSATDSRINANTVVLSIVFANPAAITSNVTWSSKDAGYITFTGTCTVATTANVILGQKGN